MGEAVAHESKLALLDVLLDRIQELFFRDLDLCQYLYAVLVLCSTHFQLSIGPSWDLNYHVQDSLLLIGIERNVVEGRDRSAILLDVATVV